MNTPENNLIAIQVHKELTSLYKEFLEIIEDIKLNNPSITPEQYEHLRKRVLDKGNDKIRTLTYFLDFFDFSINKEKVEEAAKQKRQIVKKVVINPPIGIE
jgi:energy-converting hydrogenase A subunit M